MMDCVLVRLCQVVRSSVLDSLILKEEVRKAATSEEVVVYYLRFFENVLRVDVLWEDELKMVRNEEGNTPLKEP